MSGIVYIATNTKNSKSYVGITTRGLLQRQKEHIHNANNKNSPVYGTKFSKAIRKYGSTSFVWSVLHSNLCKDAMPTLEIKEIKNNDSIKNGYNSTLGYHPLKNKDYRYISIPSGTYKSIRKNRSMLSNAVALTQFLVDNRAVSVKAINKDGEEKEIFLTMLLRNAVDES